MYGVEKTPFTRRFGMLTATHPPLRITPRTSAFRALRHPHRHRKLEEDNDRKQAEIHPTKSLGARGRAARIQDPGSTNFGQMHCNTDIPRRKNGSKGKSCGGNMHTHDNEIIKSKNNLLV